MRPCVDAPPSFWSVSNTVEKRVKKPLPTVRKWVSTEPILELFDSTISQDADDADCDIGAKRSFLPLIWRNPVADLRRNHPHPGWAHSGEKDHERSKNIPESRHGQPIFLLF